MTAIKLKDGRKFDGVQVITQNDNMAGFCALLTYAMNGVRYALAHNRLAVVSFEPNSTLSRFYDPIYGENVWDYYFEPVMDITADALRKDYPDVEIYEQPWEDVLHDHQHDPERIATFWAWDVPENPAQWMAQKRQLGRDFISRFVKVKPHIQTKVDAFVEQQFSHPYMVAVHIRGTDFAYAKAIPVERYFEAIDAHLSEQSLEDFGIYLATDQIQFVDQFRERYGDRVVCYECLRSDNEVAPFMLPNQSPYAIGEEMLIDILLMAKCNHLVKGPAAGGEYSLWFAPALSCTDLALESRFEAKSYESLQPAFQKLNVEGKAGFQYWVSRSLRPAVQRLANEVSKLKPRPIAGSSAENQAVPTGLAALIWKVSPRRYYRRLYHRGLWRYHGEPKSTSELWSRIHREFWFDVGLGLRASKRWILTKLFPGARAKARSVLEEKKARAESGEQYNERPTGSIVVHSFNQVENIERLSSAVRRTSAQEVIVAEDGSSDGSAEAWLERLKGRNDFMLRSNDLHEIRALDRAMHYTRGDIVCLLQDDDNPPEDGSWFDFSLDLFSRYPDMAVLGGWLGFTEFELKPWNSAGSDDAGAISHRDPDSGKPFMFVEHVNIGPYFIRRSAYDAIGGFDFRYSKAGVCGIYFDSDFCYRAWLNGFKVGLLDIPVGKYDELGGTHLWGRSEREEQEKRNLKLLMDTFRGDQPAINKMVKRANDDLLPRFVDPSGHGTD